MTAETELDPNVRDTSGFFGHPKGLGPLFFTELWERFSYYGMRSILIHYMTYSVAQGGLAFDTKQASAIYGWYTMAVYLTALPGGWIADYLTGARLAVLIGGIIIA
jgi:POT family proton-dependent oligopeptide transporter